MSEDWETALDLDAGRVAWVQHYSQVTLPDWLDECLPAETSEDYSIESLTLLRVYYSRWLELFEDYHKKPDDFFTALLFISKHPAFWTRRDDEPTYSWKTSEHHLDLWFQVSRDIGGNVMFLFETGGHVEPHYTGTYHDVRLDIVSRTYEEGIIRLAKAVSGLFNVDGTYRVPLSVRSV